jgi:hypothetical protein
VLHETDAALDDDPSPQQQQKPALYPALLLA